MNAIHLLDENVASHFSCTAWRDGTRRANGPLIANSSPARTGISRGKNHVVRIGFVALTDCAPLVMAQELGLFEKHGLDVQLTRESGWATIRGKILYGELDAAHAPGGMVFATTLGLGCAPTQCLTELVLNLHGNAIVLSQRMHRAGVRDGHTLREHIRRKRERITIGVVYHWSSHNVILREWLRSHGIDPERDVEIVIVPPSQVFANLRAGHLDGYCVGEPWASMAVMNRSGWVVARSAELAPLHPEKVLMVHAGYAARAHDEHLALVAALFEACAYCDLPENRAHLVEVLARPGCVNVPTEALQMSMNASYDYGYGRVEECPGFNLFARENANEPTLEKARRVIDGLVRAGLVEKPPADLAEYCFRADLHAAALAQAAALI